VKALVLAVTLLIAAWKPASAQVSITADVSKTEVGVDEQIALSVTVTGPDASLPEPKLPAMANLSVYDSGRSQSLSIVNGAVSSSISYTYVVVPRAVGKAMIPPITVSYKGQTAATQPIEITVRKPDSGMPGAPGMPRGQAGRRQAEPAPQAGRGGAPELFVTASLDKKKAFVNEQVTLTVRFYTAVSLMQSPQYEPPALSGFLAEDLPPERHGQTQQHGRAYYYSEIKTALFPAQAGSLKVGAATVRAVLPPTMADPFSADFFDRFMQQGLGGRAVQLNSDPLVLEAERLPEAGKPQGFSGAVGRFTLSAAVDRSSVKVGEAVNLTVTVAGDGNLKTIGDPVMPDMPQLRAFDTVSSLNLDKKDDIVKGSKVFKTVLVPRVSGHVTIPPIRFDYFDPKARAYKLAESRPIELEVAPGEAQAGGPAAAGPGPGAPRAVTAVARDLRYLKTAPSRGAATRALEALAFAGLLNGLPFLLFFGALGFTQYRKLAESDPAGARSRAALRAAQARLRQAREAADPARAAAFLSEALTGYLADKLGQPASGLTLKRALELSRARAPGAPAAALDELKAAWEELDMRRFAPAAAGEDAASAAQRLDALLRRLDREVFA
jgi:hypothetical protein